MSLTDPFDRDDLLRMRANYVAMLRALQSTAANNPETIDALERILPETAAEAADGKRWPSAIPALPDLKQSKHHAA